jgi:integrase
LTLPSPSNIIPRESLKTLLGVKMGSIREHKPGLWRVSFWWHSQRFDIYRDKHGEPLETERQATLSLAFIESQIRDKTFDPGAWSVARPFLFEKACQLWMDMRIISDPATRKRIVDNHLLPYWKGHDIREIRTIHIHEFIRSLREKQLSDKTVYNIAGELRACLRFHAESIPKLPVFPAIPVQEKPPQWLTWDQQEKVFKCIPEVHRGIFTFLRFTACRPSEARALQRKDVNREAGIIIISRAMDAKGILKNRTKTKRVKVLPISQKIEWTLKPREASPFVFSFRGLPYGKRQMERIWNKACKLAGISINLYNGLKHSFGCQRLNAGFPLEKIKEIMGHTDRKTTERYAKYVASSLADVMDGIREVSARKVKEE